MRKYRITINAPVVLGFVAACLIATGLGLASGGKITEALFMTYRAPLTSPLMYVRLFTHVLGHSGWSHFFGNMMFILLIGPLLEEKYGSKTLLEVIAITALVTGLVNNILFPGIALCGASGVVFAFILMASFTSFHEGEIPLTFILIAIFYIGSEIVSGITVKDNISNMAHISGGIVGSVLGYLLSVRRQKNTL